MLELTIWGARGSIPTPVAANLGFGGNTSCVSVRYGNRLLVLDAGSGLRMLGHALAGQNIERTEVDLLLTHFHWDHIQGIPFFRPIYSPNSRITFHSTICADRLQRTLGQQMCPPYFPVTMAALPAECQCVEIKPDGMELDGLRVTPIPLHHRDGASGYRIQSPRGTIVYAMDHEHGNARYDDGLREQAQGAAILMYDAQYTPREYEHRRGWGHSTWIEATRLARDAGVKQLILFHHDPLRDDAALAAIVNEARSEFEATAAAVEGQSLMLQSPGEDK
jgi:phosphoribosyl 1,2-cyclic phosphodiesterase